MNIVAGRATFTDGPPKLYAYVHREVTSAAARLDQFLSPSTLTKIDPFVLTKMNPRSAQCLVTDDLTNGRKIAANGDEEGLGGSRGGAS